MHREDCLDLRSEQQPAFVQRIMQRLLAHPVTRQQQQFAAVIVQGNGEHASQFLHALGPHFLIQVKDNFSIRMGVKAMTATFKLLAQLRKVIDFSVKNDPQARVFVVNRLSPAGKVNDTQAAHPESYGALRVDALVVRTAVNNGLTHPADVFGINYFSLPADHAGYSAHRCTSEASTVAVDSP